MWYHKVFTFLSLTSLSIMLSKSIQVQWAFNWNFIEIIIDSHVIVRNTAERSHGPFSQFPPMITINITNWILMLITSMVLIPVCPVLLMLICMHILSSIQYYPMCRLVYPQPQSRYWALPSPSSCPFITTPIHPHPCTHNIINFGKYIQSCNHLYQYSHMVVRVEL